MCEFGGAGGSGEDADLGEGGDVAREFEGYGGAKGAAGAEEEDGWFSGGWGWGGHCVCVCMCVSGMDLGSKVK